MTPGEMLAATGAGDTALPDMEELEVVNTGDRPVQVGSHYHLFEVNRALILDRAAAYGRRLAIPAGSAVRFEPGQRQTVGTVPYRGDRAVHGFMGLVNGPLDAGGAKEAALQRARAAGIVVDR